MKIVILAFLIATMLFVKNMNATEEEGFVFGIDPKTNQIGLYIPKDVEKIHSIFIVQKSDTVEADITDFWIDESGKVMVAIKKWFATTDLDTIKAEIIKTLYK